MKLFNLSCILLCLMLSGCQVVSVKSQSLTTTLANERDSILSRSKLSEASLNVLSMTGREARVCTDDPQSCIDTLEQLQLNDEQLLSTASELYLAKALSLESSTQCKVSVLNKTKSAEQQDIIQKNYHDCLDQHLYMLDRSLRYSYAYMFKSQREPEDRIFDNRQVQIRDFYNMALARLINTYTLRHPSKEPQKNIMVGKSHYHINLSHYEKLKNHKVEQIVATYNLNFSGLRSITRRDGFGAEFAIVLAEPEHKDIQSKYIIDPGSIDYAHQIQPNIHPARYLAATLVAQPYQAASVEDILHNADFEIQAFDPYIYDKVTMNKRSYPLTANFSAPYGLWLAQNNLGLSAYLSLIDRDQRLTMPHVYMLEPYNPNKKVIVLLHGLASSPEAWITLTNDIMGDAVLRENYQVWQVFYSTNMPIIESRFQIYTILKQAFKNVEAYGPAQDNAVLIGHSMGGIIARLLTSDQNLSADALKIMSKRHHHQFTHSQLVRDRFIMQPITPFSRAIFISAPHKGTAFADRWFTLAARKIIKLPIAFVAAIGETLKQEDPDLMTNIDQELIQNGPSNLSANSKFMQLTANVTPRAGFKFHSIMGNNSGSLEPNLMNDDIVPYLSSHLEGAVSEKVITGGHSIQETAEAVLELRRILLLHLKQ